MCFLANGKGKRGRGGGADSYQFRYMLVIFLNTVDKDRPPRTLHSPSQRTTLCSSGSSKGKGGRGGGADSYQFRDVLVICRNAVDKDRPPPFLRGLEASGVPAKVFASGNFTSLQEAVDDIILAKEDKVRMMRSGWHL